LVRNLEGKHFNNLLFSNSNELNLINQSDTINFFKLNRPEYVFLAAAKVGGILANSTYKAEFIYNNIMIAANVIHSSFSSGVQKLLNLGSSCIYPKYAPQPIKEEYLLTGELESTNEPYAIAKIAAIKLCRYYNEQYGTNYISVMPTNLYGNHDNYNLETSHVIAALVRKLLIAKAISDDNKDFLIKDFHKNKLGFGLESKFDGSIKSLIGIYNELGIFGSKLILWGSGKVFREFLHADDLAEACLFLMENYNHSDIGEFINIGFGTDMSITQLAHTIKEVVGFKGILEFDNSKPDGTPKKLMDSSGIFDLGWKPKISLNIGISEIVKNYNIELEN